MPADRLSALDIAFLCLDSTTTPMHMGAVAVFAAEGNGVEPPRPHPRRIAALLGERARALPRLRLRVRSELTGTARWESDPTFDPTSHIGTHELADDGRADPLTAHASRWLAQPLDPKAPLWQLQVVSGFDTHRFALLVKIHHALCDGAGAVELALGLLEGAAVPGHLRRSRTEPEIAKSAPLPRLWRGARDAVEQSVTDTAESIGIAGAVLRATRPFTLAPTTTVDSTQRRLGFVQLEYADIKRVRRTHGGTTNDIVLTVLAGALREWLRNRNDDPDTRALRALVPVSTRRRRGDRAGGNALSAYLCELPVDSADPLTRLAAVSSSMGRNKRSGPWRGAGAIPVLAERLPCALHRLATRAVAQATPMLFDTVVTTVPLPSRPLTLGGAALHEVYPVVPLAPHQSVGFAVALYRDGVGIGLHTGGDAVADAGSLADAVAKAMAELLRSVP